MRIPCPRCKSQYDVPDERLARGAVKIRCAACQHAFAVRARPADSPQTPSGPAPLREGRAAGEMPSTPPPEARFEDVDLDLAAERLLRVTEQPGPQGGSDEGSWGAGEGPSDTLESLGDLDLGDLGALDRDFDLRGEPLAPGSIPQEPAERVREDELLSPRTRTTPSLEGAVAPRRVDLQPGSGHTKQRARPSPLAAKDRGRSPLFWAVAAAALATLAYTGYNLQRHPDAFTFLSPAKVRSLWQSRQIEAVLGVEGLTGYYRDLQGDRRAFVIRGEVINRSSGNQSLIRVQGSLFGKDGRQLAVQEVFCGNVVSDAELDTLSPSDVEARLQNEVGDAMQNLEVAPGGRVPFTVVFLPPPAGVDSFSVRPVGARAEPGT